jgi:hypothetical protein
MSKASSQERDDEPRPEYGKSQAVGTRGRGGVPDRHCRQQGSSHCSESHEAPEEANQAAEQADEVREGESARPSQELIRSVWTHVRGDQCHLPVS